MDQSFEMTIGSDIEEIPAVSARLEKGNGGIRVLAEEILDTQLAVEEVITNIIVHGYKRPDGEIHLSCRFTGNRIAIRITDSAPRFDPLSIPDRTLTGISMSGRSADWGYISCARSWIRYPTGTRTGRMS